MAKTYLAVKCPVLQNGNHYITCDWGYYSDGKTWHKGIDMVASNVSGQGGDYVVAFADGVVIAYCNTMSGTTDSTGTAGMGNYVSIKHNDGYITRYHHLLKGSVKVKTGDKVTKGQVIGYMGNTGNSTGRHLHFDISSDTNTTNSYKSAYMNQTRYYVDPKPFLLGVKTLKPTSYRLGTYEITSAVNVRKGPGTTYDRILYSGFTASAKQQIQKIMPNQRPNDFPAGLRVTISEIRGDWGKCPTGWINLHYCKSI